MEFQECLKELSKNVLRLFEAGLRMSDSSIKVALRVFQGCFKGMFTYMYMVVLRFFQGIFKYVFWCFRTLSMAFQGV